MSRSYLTVQELSEFKVKFRFPNPHGLESENQFSEEVQKNSDWLEKKLLATLRGIGDWDSLHPVVLGSWARSELCPASDLDIIFLGDEKTVFQFVEKAEARGLKLRYRVPMDANDWTVGVEAFDILALYGARGLTEKAQVLVHEQQEKLARKFKLHRAKIRAAVINERKRRQKRLDSISHFLEPNIKYSPGGLRDIEQGLSLFRLYSDKIHNPLHALKVLKSVKYFLLLIRQRKHVEGHQDILTGPEQLELAAEFGYASLGDFMREVQRGLARSFFYSEWILAGARESEKAIQRFERIQFKRSTDLAEALKKNSGILMQKRVREGLDQFFKKSKEERLSPVQWRGLKQMLSSGAKDEFVVSVFSSRLIDKLLPPVEKLFGHVQHDQYHRFTADVHLQQACRQFHRVRKNPRGLGELKALGKGLAPKDWEILGWACLFHDLSKGQGGDHSKKGAEQVLKMIPARALNSKQENELAWLVENHLLLSQLAFRRSSSAAHTLDILQKQNTTAERLKRLAVFTVIDILATNPEAWTPWKGQILRDFVVEVLSPEARSRSLFLSEAKKNKVARGLLENQKIDLEKFDSFLLQNIPMKTLIADLTEMVNEKVVASVKVFHLKGRSWVRFHDPKDRPGLLVEYVDRLHQAGGNVQHASVQTLESFGVYDWFQVKIPKNREKWLQHPPASSGGVKNSHVRFSSVEILPNGPQEWIVRLEAREQKGLLKFACERLAQVGADIKSARVHTWGLKVEDVFTISYSGTAQDLKEKLTSF